MMIKISKAEVFKHRYALEGYKLTYGIIKEVFPVILKLTDEHGNIGWGEANPQQPFTDEDADEVIRVLRSELLPIVLAEEDADPVHVDHLLNQVRPQEHLLGKGAINVALLDLKGKILDVSIAELLGGPIRHSIQVSHPLNNGVAEDDMRVIDEKVKQGCIDYMLKMGTSPIRSEIERVGILEERYGDRVRFKADANTGWTRDQALEFLAGVSHSSLVNIPILADESLTGMNRAEELIRTRAADVFSIKITKNGGIMRAQALTELAKEHGIPCFANSMLEGGITQAAPLQLAVTITNLVPIGHSFRSVLRLTEGEVTDFASNIRDAMVYLPQGPGLGVQVDETKLRSCALEFYVMERRDFIR